MLEIVFGDSACGSLKAAQHYGKEKYIGGCISVIVSKSDGAEPTQDEINAAQKEAEEWERLSWKNAVPMGGNPEDVFGFNLILSIGDISEGGFEEKRKKVINELFSIYPNDEELDFTKELKEALKTICERAVHGEDIRIWYSNQPDELCGLYWFMSELNKIKHEFGKIYIVKLPEYQTSENVIIKKYSWGEVTPGEWHKYTAFAEPVTESFIKGCASYWKTLQQENRTLRASINGQLLNIPENIYDDFIIREIEEADDEFQEVVIIGRVLGKYHLGIGDAWIAHRIEKMISDDKLTVISKPLKNMPIYHRILKKCK